MIRRLKAAVLKDLPPKLRQRVSVVVLCVGGGEYVFVRACIDSLPLIQPWKTLDTHTTTKQ